MTQTLPIQNHTVKFEIWDTAGKEQYKSLAPMYYRGASAAIVVYDITSQKSFDGAKSWVKELQTQGSPNCAIALAGNKIDKEEERQVATADAKQYAQDNAIMFIETSAKDNINIREAFIILGRELLRDVLDDEQEDVKEERAAMYNRYKSTALPWYNS